MMKIVTMIFAALLVLSDTATSDEPVSTDRPHGDAPQDSPAKTDPNDGETPVTKKGTATAGSAEQNDLAVPAKDEAAVRLAAGKAIELLQIASAGSAEQRTCFNCHGQAMPVIAFSEANHRGIDLDAENFQRQVKHAHAHLRRGKKSYLEGKGQGGGVDTAGYALWTLEEGSREPDEVSHYVVDWLIEKQRDDGHWKCSSNRPPSEASDFTSTYLALRALGQFADEEQTAKADEAASLAAKWLATANPKETEDLVFYLLSLEYAASDEQLIDSALKRLCAAQRADGGWAQKEEMNSDAYATGSALYALSESGMSPDDDVWQKAIGFLLASQKDDGSWHVVSRSKPFQKYFESGFPHEKDQFISTSATAWAAVALLRTLPVPTE